MKAAAVIPARYGSTRLPGKPLLRDTGRYLIEHVWLRVRQSKRISRVVIATDDLRILAAAEGFGAEAVMTSPSHPSGTDRAAEAAAAISPAPEIVVNVQGDEPEIDPADLDALVDAVDSDPDAGMATLAYEFEGDAGEPSLVKVVTDSSGRALYFSRAAVPFYREGSGPRLEHIGVYAFRAGTLRRFVGLPESPIEKAEKLEQNRALWWGIPIKVVRTRNRPASIDTPADYESFKRRFAKE